MRLLFLILPLAIAAYFALIRPRSQELHNVVGCTIYDMRGKPLKDVGGSLCVFLPDGGYISALQEEHDIYRANKNGKILWRDRLQAHHQLKLTSDGNHFILLTGQARAFRGQSVRFDQIQIRDLDNRKVKNFDFFDHREELMTLAGNEHRKLWKIQSRFKPVAPVEFAHLNSVYEIPDNKMAAINPAFEKGGYIVNANGLDLMFILDSQMQNILWSLRQIRNNADQSGYHDVQVLPSGHLLVYNNRAFSMEETDGTSHTAIWDLNPLNNEPRVLYEGNPWGEFSGFLLGGVQLLKNGNLLVTDYVKGGRAQVVDPRGKVVWEFMNPRADPVTKRAYDMQEMKRMDLSRFLKNTQDF
jgi:hypothetical protein